MTRECIHTTSSGVKKIIDGKEVFISRKPDSCIRKRCRGVFKDDAIIECETFRERKKRN
ncbi:MAG: hypothetical protein NTY68_00970 [Candidatus Micrarchaeota archaeon]|nr:hypothetical protein [Candidatus Micrarchaeota archaeon]